MTKETTQDVKEKSSQNQTQSQFTSKATSDKEATQSQSQQQNQTKANATDKKDTSKKPAEKRPCFDELQTAKGQYRPAAQAVGDWLDNTSMDAINHLNEQAENIFYRKGVTFTVYSDAKNIERMIPFDIVPRIIAASEGRRACQLRLC